MTPQRLGTFGFSLLFPFQNQVTLHMMLSALSGTEDQIRVEIAESDEAFNQVFAIRRAVFVEESNVDEEDEYDGMDHLATHFLAWYGKDPAGTARRRRLISGAIRVERFSVLKGYRGQGIGRALVEASLKDLPAGQEVVLHSLVSKVSFYERFGFVPIEEEFEEVGLPHRKMVLLKQ